MAKGFGRMGGQMGGGMGNMRHQFQSLQKQMMEQQEKIAEMEVSSSVGGGALKITMSGDQVCKNVEIDPEFLKDVDAEMLQDMLITGINSAIEQSKKIQEEHMNSITGGLASGLSGLGLGF
ncbi:MAG: YbaB/EbfC family nucleoid-associated protein [Anaerolineaceae bacterium]|nr:YbaB/EbfC family nucleoid-associated protein [Anaerolineaceae bacterium]